MGNFTQKGTQYHKNFCLDGEADEELVMTPHKHNIAGKAKNTEILN
jgi:hypothetical protein